jgi:hypothetical protein
MTVVENGLGRIAMLVEAALHHGRDKLVARCRAGGSNGYILDVRFLER